MINKPLGLPEGSVRAILVILITVAAIVGIFIDVKQSDKLIAILSGAPMLYIGGRMNWNKSKLENL